MLKYKSLPILAGAAALGILALFASPAGAVPTCPVGDFCSDFTQPNSDVSGFTGPYGFLDISLTGQIATAKFTSNTVGGNIYLFGDGGSVALNLNTSSYTLGSLINIGTNAGTNFTPGPWSCGLSMCDGSVSGLQMILGVLCSTSPSTRFDGFTHASDKIIFTQTNTNLLTPWASAANVLKLDNNGLDAAAHIFVTSSPADGHNPNGAIATGFVGEVVPAPIIGQGLPVLLAFGGVLFGAKFFERSKKRNSFGTALPHAAA